MSIKRPRREHYATDVAWHVACLNYLDAKWPGREGQRKRIAAWERWSLEHDPERVVKRMRELLSLDALTPAQEAEWDRLAAIYRAQRLARTTPTEEKR